MSESATSNPAVPLLVPAESDLVPLWPSEPPLTVPIPNATTATGELELTSPTAVRRLTAVPLPPAPAGYDMFRHLGGGGMGDVFLAREHATDRPVAMKFLRTAGSRSSLDRFLIEVRALAAIDHPNIVRIFSTDFLRADPYFTMELANGGSLARHVSDHGPLSPADAARVMAAVARAIAAAHDKGILHRDLKPSNILLQEAQGKKQGTGEVAASSEPAPGPRPLAPLTPLVSDFGLAKRLGHDDGATIGSGPIGTPSYMPPEQITTRNGDLGPTSDVYGLGATLFHLLTGQPPFGPGEQAAVIHQVLTDPVPRVRAVRPDVPLSLEGIVAKCLEKDPADRYPTAAALADDLDRFLAGQAPAAPQLTRWRRARRWVSRRRHAVAGAVLTVLVVSGLGMAARPTTPPDPLLQIEAKLDAGEPVTLVGETGPPRYHRWVVSEGNLARSEYGDGTCALQTHGLSFLELVRDPRHDRYRFSAELRHDGGERSAAVGLYVGIDAVTGQTGVTVFPVLLTMHDDFVNDYDRQVIRPKGRPVVHAASLRFATPLSRPGFPPFLDRTSGVGELGHKFAPHDGYPRMWRTVVLNVTPEGVTMSWGETRETVRVVHTATASEIATERERVRRELPRTISDRSVVVPDWHPRRPLGVWAQESTVSIRNVKLEPNPK